MKRFSLVFIVVLSVLSGFIVNLQVPAQEKVEEKHIKVAKYLQDISVTVRAGPYSGSGVFVQTKDGQVWIWTAAHVVEALRRSYLVLDPEKGTPKLKVEWDDAKIQRFYKNKDDGRIVSTFLADAEVIRYSDANYGHDLALLRLRDREFKPVASAKFYLDKELPDIGEDLYHCGSLLGTVGSNSLTGGLMSQHGRVLDGKIYDQTSCTAFPGSSGGIVCLKSDGRYVGMLVMGAGEGFNLIVPVRRMYSWAKTVGVEFAMNPEIPVPSDEELLKKGIESQNAAHDNTDNKKAMKDRLDAKLRYWIHDETKKPEEEKNGLELDFFKNTLRVR
jgi:hypothetical protein